MYIINIYAYIYIIYISYILYIYIIYIYIKYIKYRYKYDYKYERKREYKHEYTSKCKEIYMSELQNFARSIETRPTNAMQQKGAERAKRGCVVGLCRRRVQVSLDERSEF